MTWLRVQPAKQISLLAQFEHQEDVFAFLNPVNQSHHMVFSSSLIRFSGCQSHRSNLLVDLPVYTSDSEVWSVHDLDRKVLSGLAVSYLEDFGESTAAQDWCL
jgi:hypothetical protein